MGELMTGGRLIAKSLKAAGIELVFGIAGHGNQGILEGMAAEGIRHITVHNEIVGAAAAAGYFKATHKPGVLSATCGPGMIMGMPGLVQAAVDSSAVIVVAGDVPISLWGKGASEELDVHAGGDQSALYRPFAKRVFPITVTENAGETVAHAYNVATSGRPGVVLVSLPFDLQHELVEGVVPDIHKRYPTAKPTAPASEIRRAAEMLLGATRPVIVAGGGAVISGAWDEVTELAEELDAPVVTSSAGKSAMSCAHPLYAGQCGRDGPPFSSELTKSADVIISIGMRFEEYETSVWKDGVTFNFPPTKLIQIDIDPREIGKNYPVECGLVGDARLVTRSLIDAIRAGGKSINRGTADALAALKNGWLAKLEAESLSDEIPINSHRLIHDLKDVLPPNAVMVIEASTVRTLAMQHYIPLDKRNLFVEQGIQEIGYAAAESLGVKVGRPNQPVICLTGDGALLLTNQVIPTAVEFDIPVVWVVQNNYGYRSVWSLQQKFFNRGLGSAFEVEATHENYSPDFAKLAEAYGAYGQRVEDPGDIKPAIQRALEANRASVIDVRVKIEPNFAKSVSTPSSWDYYAPTWQRGARAGRGSK